MPKHLFTIPHGTALPSTTGLPEGYPFLLETGSGASLARVLHQLQAGAFVPVAPPAKTVPPFLAQVVLTGTAAVKNNAFPPYGIYVPQSISLTELHTAVGTAPVGGPLTVTITTNTGQVLSTATIADGQVSGLDYPTAGFNQGYLRVNVTTVGTTTPGADLSVTLVGTYT